MVSTKIVVGDVEIELQSETEITVKLKAAPPSDLQQSAEGAGTGSVLVSASRDVFDAFVAEYPRKFGTLHAFQDLKTACARWLEDEGFEARVTDKGLAPALERAGFAKKRDSAGRALYVDRRTSSANDAVEDPDVEIA